MVISSDRIQPLQYVTAVLFVGVAATLTYLLRHFSLPGWAPLFFLAVAVSAWRGGLGPGLAATMASLLAIGVLVQRAGDWGKLETVELVYVLALVPVAIMLGLLHAGKSRAQAALRERDRRLQLVSEQIPGGVWSTDTDLRITSGFGAQSSLLHGGLGATLAEHFHPADDKFEAIAAHRRALRGQSCSYELTWGGRTFQCHVEPLRMIDGEIIGVVGVATDITERKSHEQERERLVEQLGRAKAELEEANRQLEEQAAAKDKFLAMLSHELRTPLTPVLALASALEARADLPADVREDLQTVHRNAELEVMLIDDLLDLTRIARGKLQLNMTDVDAHDPLRSAVDVCRSDAQQKGVDLVLDLGATRRAVRADAARLQQVYWNLLKNAVKFTPPGGRVVVRTFDVDLPDPAEVNGQPRTPRLRIEVADTGIGIAPELLPRIFDAFEQGGREVTRQFGGLGLGLAICKTLVDAHAGRISAHSAGTGTGASFRVELPTVDAPPTAARQDGAPGAPADVRGLDILLVEDHADTARVLQRLLVASGHRVETAGSVEGAREALTRRPVDLLISDIGLPDGSGLELMRDLHAGHAVKGIALSGFGAEADVQECLQAGFAAHLVKPVAIQALKQAIARVAAG